MTGVGPTAARPRLNEDEAPGTDDQRFEELACVPVPGLLHEFWLFLGHNKEWWMLPILLVMLGFGVLVLLSSTPLAPFLYTLF